jgi:uncharacterized membrane protein AbrB (regulator of aidB expression)
MMYLMELHWGWLTGAVLIGLAMGWVSVVYRGAGLSRRGLQWAVVILGLAVGLAVSRTLPGRYGYWLDLGLVIFMLYLAGCIVGSWLRRIVVLRHSMPEQ